MRADILIVGQGVAGTLLGWEMERAGLSFTVADRGHPGAASMVAAGIINPITGRRLVKSWRYESLFPMARDSYRALEAWLGVSLWHEMRVRRTFADERERALGSDLQRQAELAPYIESVDDAGWWIRNAARVDLQNALPAARRRWAEAGKLREEAVVIASECERYALVIDCRGGAVARARDPCAPWEFSKGEVLELDVPGVAPDVILNRRMWVVPTGPGTTMAGATHQPGVLDPQPSVNGRATIETAAREILGETRFAVTGHRAGIRVNLPDKRPIAGRDPRNARLGVLNGLGAKGVLWAPQLARQWVEHLTCGAQFDREIAVGRFGIGST